MKAAVIRKTSAPLPELAVENVDVGRPLSREVLVRTVATGVCHSDLHYLKGDSVMPMPAVLGHEARASSRRSARTSPTSAPATT